MVIRTNLRAVRTLSMSMSTFTDEIRSTAKRSRTWLVFEGLDTFVEIKLCDKLVANVANQFRQFTFDVTDILPKCSGDPVISLNFGSAASIVLEIAKTGPGIGSSTLCSSPTDHGE